MRKRPHLRNTIRFPPDLPPVKRKPEPWRKVIIGGLTAAALIGLLIYVVFNPAL